MKIGNIKLAIKKYPVGTAAAAVLLLVCGGYFFRNSTYVEMQAALGRNTEESFRYHNNISNSVQLEEQLKALEAANRVIANRLVTQELAVTLQYFYKLEADTGVKLLDTRPAGSANLGKAAASMKAGYKPVQYALSLQGNYVRVLTFLRKLEQGTFYCRVVSANCYPAQEDVSSKDKPGTSEVVLSLTVEILGKA